MREHIQHMHLTFSFVACVFALGLNSSSALASDVLPSGFAPSTPGLSSPSSSSSSFTPIAPQSTVPGIGASPSGQSPAGANSAGSGSNSRMLQAQISHSDAMSRSELSAAAAAAQVSIAAPIMPAASAIGRPNLQGAAQSGQFGLPGTPQDAQAGSYNLQSAAQNNSYNLQASAAQPGSYNLQAGSAQNGAFNLQAAAKTLEANSDMAADVRKVEYNVDWASWLAKVADRWFFILDQYERSTHQHYVTVRPALFRFTCYNNGQIANVTMKQSSGNVAYDQLQMVALMQSMPVPQFPFGTRRQTITLVQGWESHVRQQGESDYIPGSFGRGFPSEKVEEWVQKR